MKVSGLGSTERRAVIKDLPSENPNQIKRTQIGNLVVSTVVLDDIVQGMDNMIGMFSDLAGVEGDLKERKEFLQSGGDYETMVFECDENGKVTNWTEKHQYSRRYTNEADAEEGHQDVVEELE